MLFCGTRFPYHSGMNSVGQSEQRERICAQDEYRTELRHAAITSKHVIRMYRFFEKPLRNAFWLNENIYTLACGVILFSVNL